MEYAQDLSRPFPWRAATAVAAAIAALELLGLVVLGAILLARPIHHQAVRAAAVQRAAVVHRPIAHARHAHRLPAHTLLPRSRMSVLVLNGNGVNGAAARESARLSSLGYRIDGSRDAARHDYARSMVMYVPSFAHEAHRLAHDTGIRLVTPVDGMTPRVLRGVKLVVLLGN